MRALTFALQALIVYMALAVLIGIGQQPQARVVVFVAVGAFFAGLLALTVVLPRLQRAASQLRSGAGRRAAAGILGVLAMAVLVVAQGVAVGTWRGPSRLLGLHDLTVQFAGAWALALALALFGAILLGQAFWLLRTPRLNPDVRSGG